MNLMRALTAAVTTLMIAVAALTMGVSGRAWSKDRYPVGAISIVVPYAPGGPIDIIARRFALSLGQNLGIGVAVENEPGAGGQIGSRRVAGSEPDGSVLLLSPTSHAINPSLFRELPYDTLSDFVPIALLASTPSVLVVHPSLPASTVQELIALAKAHPGEYTFASSGTGGSNHLSVELLKMMSDIDVEYVPYKSAPEVLTAVLGGHATGAFVSATSAVQLINEGRLRALATTGRERVKVLSDVPTMDEAGVKGFEAVVWFGLFGPKGLNEGAKALLVKNAKDILNSPEVGTFLDSQSLTKGQLFDTEFGGFVANEMEKWSAVVEKAGLTKQ